MSLGILKVISRLNEHKDPIMSDQEYSDIIHGRVGIEQIDFQGESVPIQPSTTEWEYVDFAGIEKLERTYLFINFKTLYYFIKESLKHQNNVKHHCTMEIDEATVKVTLLTKDVQAVTELDKELADYLDLIYKDTQYFYPVEQNNER